MPARPRRLAAVLLATLLVATLPAALAQAWPWFTESFSVVIDVASPELGSSTLRLAVAGTAVRMEVDQGDVQGVTVLVLDGDAVLMRALMPDGTVMEQSLPASMVPQVFDEGYVTAVTPPDVPDHPCVATPDTHRCERLGDDAVDGRPVELWRVESAATGHGQVVAIDRAAGVVLRAEDDGGAVMTFREHHRGPLPAGTFELP